MQDTHHQPPQEKHLFDDANYFLTQASSGKRLANYIIDLAVFWVVMYFLAYVIVEISVDLYLFIYGEEEGFDLKGRLFSLLLYGMYMGLTEALFNGRSLGKLITGTIAVNEDGSRISGQKALLRGLVRAVPFNALSALGSTCYPWHDKWNKTYVVNYKDLRE